MGLCACQTSYESVDIDRIGGHEDARGSAEGFELPEGSLFVFELAPLSSSARQYDATDVVELYSHDPDVARVVQGLEADTWMLLGVGAGQTVVELSVNGEIQDQIPVDVAGQEASS